MRCPLALVLFAAVVACTPIDRDPTCVAAEACDLALERPFGDFAVTDPIFGDDLNGDGTTTDAGTCWQSAESAVPCIDGCTDFVQEQLDLAIAQGNQAVIDACGGVSE